MQRDIFCALFVETNDALRQAITDWNALEAMSKAKPVAYTLNAELKGGMIKIVNLTDLQTVLFQRLVILALTYKVQTNEKCNTCKVRIKIGN